MMAMPKAERRSRTYVAISQTPINEPSMIEKKVRQSSEIDRFPRLHFPSRTTNSTRKTTANPNFLYASSTPYDAFLFIYRGEILDSDLDISFPDGNHRYMKRSIYRQPSTHITSLKRRIRQVLLPDASCSYFIQQKQGSQSSHVTVLPPVHHRRHRWTKTNLSEPKYYDY